MAITFQNEDITFNLKHKLKVKNWIKQTALEEGFKTKDINYIFCSDEHLLGINQQYLNHDTYTDIITFDYTEEDIISSDIFISIDRVKENAENFSIPFETELYRVLIHGILHLCGYDDHSPEDKSAMRKKEDVYISKILSL